MKNQMLSLGIVLLCCVPLSAQYNNAKVDSLILTLELEIPDTQRVLTLVNIGSSLWNNELDSAESFANKALHLSKEIKYSYGFIKANYTLGVINRKKGNLEKAKNYGKIALNHAKEKEDLHLIATTSNSLGSVLKYQGDFDSAAIYYFTALEHYEKAGLFSKMANAQNNLGNVFYRQKKSKLAEKYFLLALDGFQKENNANNAAVALMNLAKVQESDSLAMDYHQRSLAIHTKNNNINGIASININIGDRFIKSNQFEAAIPYYEKALELTAQINHKTKMAIAFTSLGQIYFKLKQPDLAIKNYEKGVALSKETAFKDEERSVYKNLAILYADQKNYTKAYTYLKISQEISDTLYSEKNLAITSELEAKFDAKQKEATLVKQSLVIEQQKNSKNRMLIGSVLSLLGIVAIFQHLYYRQKRKKQEALIALEIQKSEAKSLRELDQLKTKFFANISHELKTPLSMVITPLEEALQKSSDDHLVLAQHNSKKLFSLINEILDLSKLEAGQLQLQEKEVQLSQLVYRILYSFQSLTQSRKIKLDLNFGLPKYTGVQLDIGKFEKILTNLLSNAVKFSKSGDTIRLLVNKKKRESGDYLTFKVIDTGLGIPAAEIDHIFNRFYQSNSGKIAGGTGIGLALSKELALLFGGDLKVKSEINKGSEFTLSIPMKSVEIKNTIQEIQDPSEQFIPSENHDLTDQKFYEPILLNGDKPRILIVEDNPEMASFLTNILQPYYRCKTAFNGIDALQKLEKEQFDLITSDVMMPEMDGFEFRETMSKNVSWRQLPFIMLTASSLEDDKLKGFNLGVDDYITKPFSSRELLVRIENLLKNKSERELFQKEHQEEKPEAFDHQLLKKVEQIVLSNIQDPEFKVTCLAKGVGYSQRQLTRITKKLTGLSPVSFILEIRLQKAYQLFQNRQFATVSEIRYEVGIESAAYFTTKFKERFGKSPKEYLVTK